MPGLHSAGSAHVHWTYCPRVAPQALQCDEVHGTWHELGRIAKRSTRRGIITFSDSVLRGPGRYSGDGLSLVGRPALFGA